MTNEKTVIETLKKEANENPAANALFHVWALRHRARNQVTMRALNLKMTKEGFKFDTALYERTLKLLSQLGFGRVEYDKNGNVKALKDIRVKLQSIGKATVGTGRKLVNFKQKNKFDSIEVKPIQKPSVILTCVVNGKAVNMTLPPSMTFDEIATIMLKFQDDRTS
jgi:hypothetical protein